MAGTREEAERVLRHMSRYLMLLTLSIGGFTSIAADRMITTWIGRPYPEGTLILLALNFSFAVKRTTMVRRPDSHGIDVLRCRFDVA